MLQGSRTNIALTGFMAVGKSAVGRSLARRLRRRFVDLDRSIERAEGMRVREIFERKGEAYFRSVEKKILREVLSRDGQVLAAGGGAVMDEENLRLLKERSWLVCLAASPKTLFQRSGAGSGRPLLGGGDRKKRIDELLKARASSYAQAHVSIDTNRLSVEEVVEKILEAIRQLTTPSPLPSPSGRGRG